MTDIDLQTLSLCIQSLHADQQRIVGLLDADAGRDDAELQLLENHYQRALGKLKVLYQERQSGVANYPDFEVLLDGSSGLVL